MRAIATAARRRLARVAAIGWVTIACMATARPVVAAGPGDDFHTEPHMGFRSGDHHADLRIEFRYRWEDWKAFAPHWSDFHGLRTRLALDYRFKETLRVFAQGQQTSVPGLSSEDCRACAT